MKTPIVYYGGKSNMLKHILPLIPAEHSIYVEPFFGGGAVFFGKEPSEVEVINDNLDYAINFYRVAKDHFPELQRMIQGTLHAESERILSLQILKGQVQADSIRLAWAFWCQTQLTFAHKVFGGFAFGKNRIATTTGKRIADFTDDLSKRLRNVQIFNRDALDVIRRFDSEKTFYYLDPPYANSDCGHYEHGKNVFYDLLKLLPDLKGKWLLSSYPCREIDTLRETPGIRYKNIEKALAVCGKNAGKRKTECLTWNYAEEER